MLRTSFEGLGETAFSSEEEFVSAFIDIIHECLEHANICADILDIWDDPEQDRRIRKLPRKIRKLITLVDRPIVLMVDEVDKSTNNQLFLDFLGMLRDMYLNRNEGIATAFHSVILASVTDIKNLRMKIRLEKEHKNNSPWNIAAPFDVDMSFSPGEIATMLDEYELDYHTGMDIGTVSERLYYHTSGYPFLVSALCKMIHEKSLGWDKTGVDTAAELLALETNALFDDVIKNIENNPSFSDMVEAILIQGKDISYVISDRDVSLGFMYGIFKREGTRVAISNRIYEKFIYEHMLMRVSKLNLLSPLDSEKSIYIKNNRLDMKRVITRFSEFMHREYRRETSSLVEVEGRLLFLAYLRPIINGAGHYFVEVQTRGNTRMDIVVTFGVEVFIVELKIWHGEEREKDAYDQLVGYVKSQGESIGYLISFCDLRKQPRENKTFIYNGIEIHETIIAYKDVV